jgi:integrase
MPAIPSFAHWCRRHSKPDAATANSRGSWEPISMGMPATLSIAKSKSGKPRHVILTLEGADFFRQHCAGRSGNDLMFRHADGSRRQKSDQARPMRAACEHAKITPRISFHILRHTWASLAVMAGMPLMVVARNLGHADTRMVEKHYGHLAPSFVVDMVRAGAPRFDVAPPTSVVPYAGKSKRK